MPGALAPCVATSEQRERFTCGDCWILALQINAWDPSWQLAINGCENHAFCARQDRFGEWWALDVTGAQPLEDLLTDWGARSEPEPWKLATAETFLSWRGEGFDGEIFDGSWEEAPELAWELIEDASELPALTGRLNATA